MMASNAPVAEKIRLLEPSEDIFFKGYSPSSIRAIVSRVRDEFSGKRTYHTKALDNGVMVWRLG